MNFAYLILQSAVKEKEKDCFSNWILKLSQYDHATVNKRIPLPSPPTLSNGDHVEAFIPPSVDSNSRETVILFSHQELI